MSNADEDRHAATAIDSSRLSPSDEASPDDCGPGRGGRDQPGVFGRGAAVPAEAGFDVRILIFRDN